MTLSADLRKVVQAPRLNGLLLESDVALPNVVTLVTGEPVRNSWWRHPNASAIYAVTQALPQHPDALNTKLVSGKLTYVYRGWWSPLLAIAMAHEQWQLRDLSDGARALLRSTAKAGELRTDELPRADRPSGKRIGDAVRELERRLLVYSQEVHTPSGAHAKRLASWECWMQGVGFRPTEWSPEDAKREFERVIVALNARHGGTGRLPWTS